MKKSATLTTVIAGLGAAALIAAPLASATGEIPPPPPAGPIVLPPAPQKPVVVVVEKQTNTVKQVSFCLIGCGVTVNVNTGDVFSHNPVKVVTKIGSDIDVTVKQVNKAISTEVKKAHKQNVENTRGFHREVKKLHRQVRKAFGK